MLLLTALMMGLATPIVAEGSPKITDGDTIRIGDTRIRLEGIDAPEMNQHCKQADGTDYQCGVSARDALIAKIDGHTVRCYISGTDMYRRSLGTCFVGKLNLNEWLVQSGWAVAYRHYSTRYVPQEDQARAADKGIWAGEFEMPWEYRAERRRH